MTGYIFMVLAALVLLPLLFLFFGRGRGPRPAGKDGPGAAPWAERKSPAADEPTPGISTPRDRDGGSRVPPA